MRDVIGLDDQSIAVRAPYLQAIEVRVWHLAMDLVRANPCGHKRTRHKIEFRLLPGAVLDASFPRGYGGGVEIEWIDNQ